MQISCRVIMQRPGVCALCIRSSAFVQVLEIIPEESDIRSRHTLVPEQVVSPGGDIVSTRAPERCWL